MKKTVYISIVLILSAFLVVLLCFVKFGYGELKTVEESSIIVGTRFDVTMEIVEGSVKSDSLIICVKNNTDIEIDSGNEYDFVIEVLDNEKWYTVKTRGRGNTSEALVFEGERNLNISWSTIYGVLPSGHYRIVKHFFPWTEDGTYGFDDGFYLSAEFDIA